MASTIHYQAFKTFLGPKTVEGFRASSSFRKDARGKLQKLPYEQFAELTNDVYDELMRRTKDLDHITTDSGNLPSKRNQARQKLGTLSDKRFYDLIGDLFIEILIRFPNIDPSLKDDTSDKNKTKGEGVEVPVNNAYGLPLNVAQMPKEAPNLTSKHINGDKGSMFNNKYDNELNQALKVNNNLEWNLSKKYNENPITNVHSTMNDSLSSINSASNPYDILKHDYHQLRKEFEKLHIQNKSLSNTNERLQAENEELKESISLYEKDGSLDLASQLSTLQKEHSLLKHEYTVELSALREKYLKVEAAQASYREMFEAISKNNEILEFKLRQVNNALEKSQKDSANLCTHGSSSSESDLSNSYLITDQIILNLRSTVDKFLDIIKSGNSDEILLSIKPLVETGRGVIDIVDQFEAELQDDQHNCRIQITNNKEDFSSALSNLMTLAKQQSSAPTRQNLARFEYEVKELLQAADDLQMILQTNFCALPFFSSKPNRFSMMPKANDTSRFTKAARHMSSMSSLSQISRIPQTNEDHDFHNDILDNPILDPLRGYLEEQSDDLIESVEQILEYVRNDDFSTQLTDGIQVVYDKANRILNEFKQYSQIPCLIDSKPVMASISGLENANARFLELLKDLEPIVYAKDLTIEEIDELDSTLKLLKNHLASTCHSLAKSIRALSQALV